MGLFPISKQQQEHLVFSSHCFMLTADSTIPLRSLSLWPFYSTLKVSSLEVVFIVYAASCKTLIQTPVCTWVLLLLPLTRALIKGESKGGKLTCCTKLLLYKTWGEMTNARWPGGEEGTSGSVFSTPMAWESMWGTQLEFRCSSCPAEPGYGVGGDCVWLQGDEVKGLGSCTVSISPLVPGAGPWSGLAVVSVELWPLGFACFLSLITAHWSSPADSPHSGSHCWSRSLSTPMSCIQPLGGCTPLSLYGKINCLLACQLSSQLPSISPMDTWRLLHDFHDT